MMIVLADTGIWELMPGEPAALRPGPIACVRLGLAIRTLGVLRSRGVRMGPVQLCGLHKMVHLPVTEPRSGLLLERAGRAGLAHTTACPYREHLGTVPDHGQLWLLDSPDAVEVRTDFGALYDALHMRPGCRTALRTTAA
ncbi:hypothetical protein LHJ74_11525 [Streptomyces sp. N2-109]|uniref:DUF5753 domain-containing protein n=1 Tax=Streptomyces gossypii TaxID=2883101 RepID=A0ABT2JRZ6_9ACTN|nr:hypothetical protein [Streptomyces gossypii]MCT2590531.1 hypothetical protein [Streptomyces gossypii]